VTFTAVAPMIAIGNANGGGVDGLLAIYGAVIVAGVATFFAAPYFSRLLRLFPPVVTGTVITVIGVTLLPVAAQADRAREQDRHDHGARVEREHVLEAVHRQLGGRQDLVDRVRLAAGLRGHVERHGSLSS
jgi:xanthine/uracil permease